MKAIQFNFTIPRYILGLVLGKVSRKIFWSGLTCTDYKEIPTPDLPGDDWVMIKTRYGGICGTDTSTVFLVLSPYLTPFASFPLTLGHEGVGRIAKIGTDVSDWQVGQRVVVEPVLWCKPRGFEELCRFCARGEINRCERFTEGDLAPGIQIGACRDTGGSWSPYFVAHKSQLYPVPEEVSDENALMIEPFAIALHAVLQNYPEDTDKVLIIGAGTIGLLTLVALRALGSQAEIVVLGKYGFQTEAAQKLGASQVILGDRNNGYYEEIARWSDGSVKNPALGKPIVIGGVDSTFECVGNQGTLDDSMRVTRNGGKVILMGAPGVIKGLDWSSIFTQELSVKAANLYNHVETHNDKEWKTFDLAIELIASGEVDLGWLVTHKYQIEDYKKAFDLTYQRGKNQAIKIAFQFDD
jgi:threonine dehydrogenase-like Zn-dependent dehydrogenase